MGDNLVGRSVEDAFFDACAPDDPLSAHYMNTNRADYATWRSVMPDPLHDDVGVYSCRMASRLGTTETLARQNFDALLMLHSFPQVAAVIEQLAHIDLWRLRAIERAVIGVEDYALDAADADIARYLTPKYPHQHLPGATAIRNRVRKIVLKHDPDAAERDEDESRRSLGFTPTSGGGAKMMGYLPMAEAKAVEDALRSIARKEECSLIDALMHLISSKVDVRVVLNVYQSEDKQPDYLDGAGYLSPRQSQRLLSMVTSERKMNEDLATQVTDAYLVPAAMAAYVRGRDGTCRGPGCQVPAARCDLDHRIPFNQGGLTTPANLHALCRKCHNRKTDGVMKVVMDAMGADHWLFPDGSIVVTTPDGPISWPSRVSMDGRWRQNWEERSSARRENRREENRSVQRDCRGVA